VGKCGGIRSKGKLEAKENWEKGESLVMYTELYRTIQKGEYRN
jgi:hypothetical protein